MIESLSKVSLRFAIQHWRAQGTVAMIMTNSERQWLARVMHTISHVTIMEPCNALDRPVQNGAGEDVLRAAQNFIEVLQRGHPK
jgi:hypothetical protein